jgi:tRNA(fMet)-specific endonuclease VapC
MIVLDTDILIDFLRGKDAAVGLLARLEEDGEELATTCVNAAELWRGGAGTARHVQEALDRLLELPLDAGSARRFGQVMSALDRAGRPIPEVDGLVAAIALEHGGRIATGNRRHFARVAGVRVVGTSESRRGRERKP